MKQRYSDPSWPLTGLFSLLLFLGLACPAVLHAQSYQLPAAGTANIITCSGMLYDNGGASGTMTIMPAAISNKIRLQFTSIGVQTEGI